MNVTTGRGERQEEEEGFSPHPGQGRQAALEGGPRGAEAGSTQSCGAAPPAGSGTCLA